MTARTTGGKELRSRKVSRDTIVTRMELHKKAGVPRTVSVTVPKAQMEPGEVWPYMNLAIQSALTEMGVKLDITIRERGDSYEVVLEE